ncbi:MAG: rod shape-determining protein [Pseudomonadota bacterium]|nr:rod shape-determining protein [Pseudomonadota bacterium]
MNSFIRSMSRNYSIDLGTANTLIYTQGQVVLNEPSIIAVGTNKTGNMKFCIVGNEAKEMVGKTPGEWKTVKPLKEGVISDFILTEKMLQRFIHKVHHRRMVGVRPSVVICVPCGSTQVERRAIKESAYGAGARLVRCIEEPVAAALGANLPIADPQGNMIIDIGGGTTEIAIISLNGIVYSQSVRIGGDTLDESIVAYVRRNYGCLIGESTAERIKFTIGTAFPTKTEKQMSVSGRHIAEGVPRSFILSSSEVFEAMQESLLGIVSSVRSALEEIPPELASDIEERGMVLSGGGALLPHIDRLLTEEIGLPVIIADQPKTCVVRGGGKLLDVYRDHADIIIQD